MQRRARRIHKGLVTRQLEVEVEALELEKRNEGANERQWQCRRKAKDLAKEEVVDFAQVVVGTRDEVHLIRRCMAQCRRLPPS